MAVLTDLELIAEIDAIVQLARQQEVEMDIEGTNDVQSTVFFKLSFSPPPPPFISTFLEYLLGFG